MGEGKPQVTWECDRCRKAGTVLPVWQVTGFSNGPHWDIALIEAPDEATARSILLDILRADDRSDTLWDEDEELDDANWTVVEGRRPLVFVLGAGCR